MKWQPLNRNFIFAFITLIVIAGCTFDKKEVPEPALPDIVSYKLDIQPMFNSICNNPGCHSGVNSASGLNLSDSVSYNNLFIKHEIDTLNPTSSNLYIFMNSNMPPSGRVPYDVALVLKWIEQKAKDN
jgi:hypothetical protein